MDFVPSSIGADVGFFSKISSRRQRCQNPWLIRQTCCLSLREPIEACRGLDLLRIQSISPICGSVISDRTRRVTRSPCRHRSANHALGTKLVPRFFVLRTPLFEQRQRIGSFFREVALFRPDTIARSMLANSRTHLHYPSQKQWLPGMRGKQEPPRRARSGAPTCSHPHG